MKKEKEFDLYMKNNSVFHDYNIEKSNIYEAGIVLEGYEIKSIVAKHCSISGAYCYVSKKNEIFISNMYVKRYENGSVVDHLDEYRERKLLLNKEEIRKISKQVNEKGMTIVPVNIHSSAGGTAIKNGETVSKKKNIIKLDIAVAQGAKAYDKREKIKQRDQEKTARQSIKRNV